MTLVQVLVHELLKTSTENWISDLKETWKLYLDVFSSFARIWYASFHAANVINQVILGSFGKTLKCSDLGGFHLTELKPEASNQLEPIPWCQGVIWCNCTLGSPTADKGLQMSKPRGRTCPFNLINMNDAHVRRRWMLVHFSNSSVRPGDSIRGWGVNLRSGKLSTEWLTSHFFRGSLLIKLLAWKRNASSIQHW